MDLVDPVLLALGRALERPRLSPRVREFGRILSVSEGVATAVGLAGVGSEEVVRMEGH